MAGILIKRGTETHREKQLCADRSRAGGDAIAAREPPRCQQIKAEAGVTRRFFPGAFRGSSALLTP